MQSNVCQLGVTGGYSSLCTPVANKNRPDNVDIIEISLKMALYTRRPQGPDEFSMYLYTYIPTGI